MESLIRDAFGFCPESLGAFLKLMNGFIAGSAPLHAYLGLDAFDWMPNDLDIWIPVPGVTKELILDGREHHSKYNIESLTRTPAINAILDIAKLFMEKHGWKRDYHTVGLEDYLAFRDSNPEILRIYPFFKNKHKIQVIFTADVAPAAILDTFDLSGCKVAWSPALGFDLTPSDVREQLEKDGKVLYLAPGKSSVIPARTRERIQKYQARGFTVMGDLKHFME
jgi:hypothetical protein